MGEQGTGAPAVSVTVVGGFLGAGKTTLLNHLLRHAADRRLGVIVNDFGSINVDAGLMVGVCGDMVELSNGCICCSIQNDLVDGLRRLLEMPSPPEHVIIEASGVSDPRRVAATLEQRVPADVAVIDAVVVVVDAEAHLSMSRRERIVAGGPIAAADVLVLNKVDQVDAASLDALEARLRRSTRRARILRASHGRVTPTLLLGVGAFDPEQSLGGEPMRVHVHEAGQGAGDGDAPRGGHEHHDHQDHASAYWTWSFRTARPFSARRLRKAIDGLPDAVVRAKGSIHLASHPDTRAVMHVVGRRAELCLDEPWGERSPTTELVLIGHGPPPRPEQLEPLFRGCEVDPGEGGPAQAVMRWVRRVLPTREAG